jgi:ankyrin repeat protein
MMKSVVKASQRKGSANRARNERHIDPLELLSLLEGKDSSDVFRRAAMSGDLSVVKALIEHGTDVDVADQNGRTALIEAAFAGNTEMVKLLIFRGASADAKDRDGWTALMEAASKGRLEIVRVLIKAGANVHLKNSSGLAALDIAAKGHLNVSRSLREAATVQF